MLGETDNPNHPNGPVNRPRDTPPKMLARSAIGPFSSTVHVNCCVRSCPLVAYRRGMCRRHYRRWLSFGGCGPVEMIGRRAPLEVRFLNCVQLHGPSPPHAPHLGRCAVWVGYVHASGFGAIWSGHRLIYVHRFAYERAYGLIPVGKRVGQLCGNRLCVRADHLQLR